ncbi:MAG: hypothetical protein QM725_10670 [Lacibacter sp.]
MDALTLARVFHILVVVLWIGGVAMVTTVLIPAVKRMKSKEEQIDTFEKIEGRFALQARITTVITGLTGFYMIYKLDAWERYLNARFWWIHTMTIVWLIFTIILFILEPLILHKVFRTYAEKNPEKAFAIIHKAHWVLLLLSLLTIAGAAAGSHGLFFF